ncbi:ABC transporter permease [Actinoallomurus liliacearum]|uniref:ABC transporter permease n=1 Tax=Actinoallomurus liliacearum TaxID=1080073 RepID=A0ABP8TH25_9ACTN
MARAGKVADGVANATLREPGRFFALSLDTFRALFKWPFQWQEFLQQAWFIVSVTVAPTIMVAIPFGAILSLQVGNLIRQLGAQSQTGSTAVLAIVREASPIVTALLIAAAAGSAICADLGARKIREEIDAMEVLGINPLHRLVVPRVLACAFVGLFLNGIVSVVGIAGGYVFNVMLQGGTPGAYIASFSGLAQLSDLYQAEVKAVVFGITAALVASYKGLTASGGPKGVGDAVNQTVVIAAMALFVENFVLSALYFQLVPQKGM